MIISGYTTIKYLGVDTFVKLVIIKYDWIKNIIEELIKIDSFTIALEKQSNMYKQWIVKKKRNKTKRICANTKVIWLGKFIGPDDLTSSWYKGTSL